MLRVIAILLLIIGFCLSASSMPDVDEETVIVEYDSLDDAIECEIAGIDFSDMDGVNDYAICGCSDIEAEVMTSFVRRFNPDFDEEIAERYLEIGAVYGLRGDVAFCQAILETGWFRFDRGTAVTPNQHNYCGLGVVERGLKGAAFETIKDGVTAHLQHLYAYATQAPLPDGEIVIDPRFKAVKRGVAKQWSDLNNRWAMNSNYGSKILKIYSDLQKYKLSRPQ